MNDRNHHIDVRHFKDTVAAARRDWEALAAGAEPVIHVGTASCGRAAGALGVLAAVRETLAADGLRARVVEVGCIGPCYLEPLLDVTLPGRPRLSYGNVTPDEARAIVRSHLAAAGPPPRPPVGHFGPAGDGGDPAVPRFFDLPMLRWQERIVLRNAGFIDPEEIGDALANDGYQGLLAALDKGPEGVIAEVREAGLRGRGGAGFPTHRKWEICRAAAGERKVLICNVSEGDPGAFMNRSLIESDPHSVLEGMLIAAYAIGAGNGYIYINSEYRLAIRRLRRAIEQMRENGLLGADILGSGFSFEVKVKPGGGAFVNGEETALIAGIEGRRGMPRSRPPFPAISGLFGRPTIINNVETLAALPAILRNGAAWYSRRGVPGNSGTKTFSLVGKVRRGGLIEVPLGSTTLRRIVFDIGGGCWNGFKGVQTGGPSGGCLSEEFLDTPVAYESMQSAGSIMGSGGLIAMDAGTCVVDVALYFLRFTQNESCGKCTPCRIGTWQMMDILERIAAGRGEPEDLSRLQTIAETVQRASLCGLGQTAPNPVLTTLRYFRSEYLTHVTDHRCPANVCKGLVRYDVDATRCNGCQRCSAVCPTDAVRGARAELHSVDQSLCIRCGACREVCRFDPLAANAIVVASGGISSGGRAA